MNTREAIKASIDLGKMISSSYLEDLTDQEMMHRPDPGCNHIKWQLGHLIHSENQMINACVPGALPDLPHGFAEKYTEATASNDDQDFFHPKQDLMELFEQQRAATLDALENLSDDELSNPTPESMQAYAANWGSAFVMQDAHWVMHAGQWAVIRRQLGRPAMF